MSAFELRSLPDGRSNPRLFLLQLPFRTRYVDSVAVPVTIASLDGAALEQARPTLAELLPAGEGLPRPTDRLGSEPATLRIDEKTALRLALIFNSINTLRSESKMQAIIRGVSDMEADAAAFWARLMEEDADAAQKSLNTYLLERS